MNFYGFFSGIFSKTNTFQNNFILPSYEIVMENMFSTILQNSHFSQLSCIFLEVQSLIFIFSCILHFFAILTARTLGFVLNYNWNASRLQSKA